MYLGRILSIGMNINGKPYAAYRLSSRSFPNRQAKILGDNVAIIPKEGFETDIFKNPYITYNCLKFVDDMAIVSNGSQTDVIADKINMGMNIKDALGYSLLTMDYEKDDYHTPRIAGVINSSTNEEDYECYVAIVTDSKLTVEKIDYGKGVYISTYECTSPEFVDFKANSPSEGAKYIFNEGKFAEFENPVSSASTIFDGNWKTSTYIP